MTERSAFNVIVCGEALIDLLEQPDGSFLARPGGSPTNTAVALSRLGIRTALVARLAADRFGNLLRTHLTESGVDLFSAVHSAKPTTLAVASLDETKNASYSFYIDGCADGSWSTADIPNALDATDVLVVSGSLALPTPAMAEVMENLLHRAQGQLVVVFDPNIRPALITDKSTVTNRLDRWITQSTIVKASAEDVAWRWPDKTIEEVAHEWIEQGVALIVITDGARGAYGYTTSASTRCEAPAVDVIDTIGAGDTFTAGLINWLAEHSFTTSDALRSLTSSQLKAALDAAIALASDTCTRPGADPPWATASNSGSIAVFSGNGPRKVRTHDR
ncbi:MAG: carbohydrate kinase [Acidimicrobiales bacterium]|nr:MAG: carbohydrate kinase [Acidimicrobiales bacterium]